MIYLNIVYGGSFNPPTVAHEAIIKELKRKFNPKNLIILPTGNSYVRKDLLDFKHRYEMLKLISNDIILSLENEEKKYLGTVGALDILSLQYDDLYFVMGADNLIDIKTWIEYERLLKTYNFIVITRDDIDVEVDGNVVMASIDVKADSRIPSNLFKIQILMEDDQS